MIRRLNAKNPFYERAWTWGMVLWRLIVGTPIVPIYDTTDGSPSQRILNDWKEATSHRISTITLSPFPFPPSPTQNIYAYTLDSRLYTPYTRQIDKDRLIHPAITPYTFPGQFPSYTDDWSRREEEEERGRG